MILNFGNIIIEIRLIPDYPKAHQIQYLETV